MPQLVVRMLGVTVLDVELVDGKAEAEAAPGHVTGLTGEVYDSGQVEHPQLAFRLTAAKRYEFG